MRDRGTRHGFESAQCTVLEPAPTSRAPSARAAGALNRKSSMSTNLICPHCNATLQVLQPPPVGTRIKCPKCNQVFAAAGLPVARRQVAPPPVPVASPGQEAPPPFRPAPPARSREWDNDE